MTMHLLPVYYTTTSTRKRRKKKTSKREAELLREHEKFLKKHGVSREQLAEKKANRSSTAEKISTTSFAPEKVSLSNNVAGIAAKREPNKHTGKRKLLGVATMHKSNMVPVWDEDSAIEIARMRRG